MNWNFRISKNVWIVISVLFTVFVVYYSVTASSDPCHRAGVSRKGNTSVLSREAAEALRYPGTLSTVPDDTSAPQVGLEVADGWLVGSDHGEWGGELVHLDRSGRPAVLLYENVVGIFRVGEAIVAVTGLAHLSFDKGEVYAISQVHGVWAARPWGALPAAPKHVEARSDGSLAIDCGGADVVLSFDKTLALRRCGLVQGCRSLYAAP